MSLKEATNQPAIASGRHLLGGTIRIFAAEALLVPTGVLTAAFLSRRFGAAEYGLLTLASVVVVWLESNVAMSLSRPAIKLIGDAEEWQPIAPAILRLYLLAGCVLALALWAVSAPLATLMDEPALAGYLRLLALDVPLFCVAQAHRNIIVGMGRFRERALISAARWMARLVLVVVFVELGRSPVGALWGSICASLVEVVICRLYVRPRLFRRGAFPVRRLCTYALPLVASALFMSLLCRLDLLLLKALGASARDVGLYGVAQNLALLPSLFSFAFAPALLSTLAHALRDGDQALARQVGRQAMRVVMLLLPVAAITAGAAPDLIALIFGQEFLPAAALLRLLIFGSLALLMIAVTTSIMTAAGKPRWTLHVAWPRLLAALAGHLILIPMAGALGAAAVTSAVTCAGAITTIGLVYKLWRIAPSVQTLWRSITVSAASYALTALLPATGFLLAFKLSAALLFVPLALLLLGEFSAEEIGGARTMLRRRANAAIEATGSAS